MINQCEIEIREEYIIINKIMRQYVFRFSINLSTRHLAWGFGCPLGAEVRTPHWRHVLGRKGRGRKGAQATQEKRQREIRNVHVKYQENVVLL